MTLILGLVIFFGIHLLPSAPSLRQTLTGRLGLTGYKILFGVIAATGLICIVIGKGGAPFVTVWEPPPWGRTVNFFLMPIAFILFTAGYLPSNIKRFTRHPMLWGVVIWSVAHLLSNGDRTSMIIFISFALYSLFDMVSANRRGAVRSPNRHSKFRDLTVILIGFACFVAVTFLHPALTGTGLIW